MADLNKVWQRQKVNKKKKQTIPEMIDNFVGRSGEFEDLLNTTSRRDLQKALITVLYSNRYKKQDHFVKELGIDFQLVRGVLYKYNEDSKHQLL